MKLVIPLFHQKFDIKYKKKTRGLSKKRASRAAARASNVQGALRCHWKNRKYGAGKLKFSTCKIMSQKIIHNLGTRPGKCWRTLFEAENFKECQFEWPPKFELT
jgi:hypothetical protein